MSKPTKAVPDPFVEQLGDRLSDDPHRPGGRPQPLGAPPLRPEPPPFQVAPPAEVPATVPSATDGSFPPAPQVSDILPVPEEDPFAEFEDPLDGESTRIDAEHLIAEESTTILQTADERPFLHVERGKDQGKEFVIGTGETSVGRSIDNDVILTDIAVSRRHMLLYVDPQDQIHIKDLGSGNGTQVNGHRVHDVIAKDGDRIEIGETVLVVRMPASATMAGLPGSGPLRDGSTDEEMPAPSFPPAPTGMPHSPSVAVSSTDYIPSPAVARIRGIPRTWLFAFMGVGALIIALLGATFTALVLRDGNAPSVSAADPGVQTWYNTGRDAYEAGDYAEAMHAFEEAVGREPENEHMRAWLAKARTAVDHEELIGQARATLAEDPAAARRLVGGVPEDSELHGQAQEIRVAATRAEVAALTDRISEFIEDGDFDAARESMSELRTLGANEEDLERLERRLERAEGSGDRPRVASASRARAPSRSRPASSMSRSTMRSTARSTSRARSSDAAILSAYRSRDFAGAARAARRAAESAEGREASRLSRLATNIDRFAQAFGAVMRGNASLSQLRSAQNLDQTISNGHFASRIQGPLADAHLRAAQSAIDRGNYAAGCPSVHQAIAVVSTPRAQRMSTDCVNRARGLVQRARGLERSNPSEAATLYNQARSMFPRGREATDAYQRYNRLVRASTDEDE